MEFVVCLWREVCGLFASIEVLVENSQAQLTDLFRILDMQSGDLKTFQALVTKVDIGKWQGYADDPWFKRQETGCDEVLENFLKAQAKI